MFSDQAWWISQFATRAPAAGLPLFRPRSKVYSRKSRRIAIPFPSELSLRLASGEMGLERLHQLCLAALAGVLYRYTGSGEPAIIVLGTPLTAGKAADGPAEVVPVLIRVDADLPFETLAQEAVTSIGNSYGRMRFSTAELIAALGMNEVQNRHPLFSTVLCIAGYNARYTSELRNDVNITVSRLGNSGSFELEYNANVHEGDTVQLLGEHLLHFMERALINPKAKIASIDYLGTEEKQRLLNEWSGGNVDMHESRCLHQLVENQVTQSPEREALIFGERSYSYAQLNAKANQLAHYLRSLGVDRGSSVGLCVSPSEFLLIGLLGILKSGAAVVPLVPTFPAFRNAMTMQDSNMKIAVTESQLQSHFPEQGPKLVCMDLLVDEIARQSSENPRTGITADDILYVLFTSGSTGRPKGVSMAHRTLVNLVLWQRDRGVDPAGKRTLQRTSIGFDVSFQEIFSTWAFGGSLVVASDDVRDDVSLLPEVIERYGIARLFLPPVALDQLAAATAMQRHSLATLKEIIVAGEQLHITMIVRRFFHDVNCTLDNQYGPTETHVATAYFLAGASTRWPANPPIGKPVRNVRVYILDSHLQPVPIGVPGQIWIGGVGPAVGYLREAETMEKFVADPFLADPAVRIYKTGDLGRFLKDGTIEFLGRVDHQVKIRGYRIELGDIEANLLQIPGVRHAAVTVHETEVLGKQLAAYIVTNNPQQPDPAAIRTFLLERLPGHMVPAPSSIVYMESLPTTATGKVDRKALPVPATRGPDSRNSAAAQSATEEVVAKIWSGVLGIERVGRDVSFIELGGHSLIAIQIVSQINDTFSIALPLRHLLRGMTIAELSAEIDRLRQAKLHGTAASAANAGLQVGSVGEAATLKFERFQIPGGGSIACVHKPETEYLYRDVFTHQTYDRAGISYPETGCIVDIGAHIGLFTLYALQKSPHAKILAVEPCPPLFAALRLNVGSHPNVRLFQFALSNQPGTAQLTYYPNLTGMSSFYPDEGQEKALLSGILRNLSSLGSGASEVLADSDEYLNERLITSTFSCDRRTLSDLIRDANLEQIDLLKIDVQKTESEVLEGIQDEDWKKIKQLAIEIHDLNGRLDWVTSLLRGKGYRVTVEQDSLHTGTVVHFVYAA